MRYLQAKIGSKNEQILPFFVIIDALMILQSINMISSLSKRKASKLGWSCAFVTSLVSLSLGIGQDHNFLSFLDTRINSECNADIDSN